METPQLGREGFFLVQVIALYIVFINHSREIIQFEREALENNLSMYLKHITMILEDGRSILLNLDLLSRRRCNC